MKPAVVGILIACLVVAAAGLFIYSRIEPRSASQHRRIIHDVHKLDSAIDQWAMATQQKDGAPINTDDASKYLGTNWPAVDYLGNPYMIGTVGPHQISISPKSKTILAQYNIDWGPY